jgi:hypothetical protein
MRTHKYLSDLTDEQWSLMEIDQGQLRQHVDGLARGVT